MTTVQIVFVDGSIHTFNVDNRAQAMQLLKALEAGKPFIGWPDAPTPVFINPAHVVEASIKS